MPQTGYCTDVTCKKELTELYECHCCNWLICLKHLLEHVEISKRDKKEQFESLRNELISNSYTLELIVEKKLQEIECEKQLIQQVKTIVTQSGHTIEDIQSISEEINQTIAANRKEETIVKVESSLVDIKPCTCSNEFKLNTTNFSSSGSSSMLQQPKSPCYRPLRIHRNGSEGSSIRKSNDHSTRVDSVVSMNSTNDENRNPTEDASDDEEHSGDGLQKKAAVHLCPLIFDGAFGLTKAKHFVEPCPSNKSGLRNLMSHFRMAHRIKKSQARRLYEAIKCNLDPHTTKLFDENEVVIDHELCIPCPFSSSMISLIGCCPTQARKIPCKSKSVHHFRLGYHLRKYHNLPPTMILQFVKNYKEKFANMVLSNGNASSSH